MNEQVVVNEGEVVVAFNNALAGKVSLANLGVSADDFESNGGFIRLVFDFGAISNYDFYAVPTIELAFTENVGETHWQCDFNDKTLVDKLDHYGKSTVILLKKNELEDLIQHHENKIVVHAEVPTTYVVDVNNSYINFFK